jgi:deazaflavin-dependent oxidoreductase (nitroreductase family)
VITDPTTPHERRTKARSLLGFRRQPGKLALLVFRLPLPHYRAGWGWLFLGRAFLVVTHVGRRTGEQHATAAMVLAEDETTGEAVICSVWGQRTDWIRNLHAHPATRVQIGRDSFIPKQRFLTEQEAFAVGMDFRRRHPWRIRLIGRLLGFDLRSDAALQQFTNSPALRPAPASGWAGGSTSHRRPVTRWLAHASPAPFEIGRRVRLQRPDNEGWLHDLGDADGAPQL